MEIQNVFVQGAGAMGSGIAQVVAQAGYHVTLNDLKEDFLKKAIQAIDKSLQKAVLSPSERDCFDHEETP